jgi:hypothetical protein
VAADTGDDLSRYIKWMNVSCREEMEGLLGTRAYMLGFGRWLSTLPASRLLAAGVNRLSSKTPQM